MRKIVLAAVLMIVFGSVVWALSPRSDAGQLMDVTGHLPDLHFTLSDDNGASVTEKNYRGDIVLLYFGFSGCAAQCPLTLAHLSGVLEKLGPTAQRARVLFISIDPQNDGPRKLHRYLSAFDSPYITGLFGSQQSLRQVARDLRAVLPVSTTPSPDMPHSNLVYIFDRAGHARFLATPQNTEAALSQTLRLLSHD